MKLLITVCSIFVVLGLAAWGLDTYLVIDDLKDCGTPDLLSHQCAPADVIVAISGGDTQARTAEAIDLYKNGWAPKLLFSGAALDTSGPSNAEAMRAQALKAGVPAKDIMLDTHATDTDQNAQGTSALLNSQDKRVILVTSPYHQRRASLEFKKVLGDSVTVVNHPSADSSWGPHWWLTPYGWWLAVSEFFKSLVVSSWR